MSQCVWMLVQILGKKNSLITMARKIKVKSKMKKKQYCHWKIFNFSSNLEAVDKMLYMQVGNFMDNLSAVQIATANRPLFMISYNSNSSGFHLTLSILVISL